MNAAWKSDIGKVRSRNEDFVLADVAMGIALLADGMGGEQGGDVASALAVGSAYAHLSGRIADCAAAAIPRLLAEALAAAHAAVAKRGLAEPELAGMGTTLEILYLRGGSAWVCHVGDSRLYLFRDGRLLQVTGDDNLAALLARQGLPKNEIPADARHVLTQAVGASDELTPELRHLELGEGDLLLLCSDGLTGMVADAEIARIVAESRDDLQRIADGLVAEANAQGGHDNVSVILVAPQITAPRPASLLLP